MHHKELRVYWECKNVEKVLLRHFQNTLEHKCIEPPLNDDMDLIEDDLPTVLTYLDMIYGKVPSEKGKKKEPEVLAMSFNPENLIVVLYRHIKQWQKLATAAGIPYSPEQQLELGLTLIQSTRDFENILGEWNKKFD